MSEEEKWIHRLPRKRYEGPLVEPASDAFPLQYRSPYAAPLPPNTLTNADGTPYSAGHDDKSLGQIVYEALVSSGAYRELTHRLLGYNSYAPSWQNLHHIEQAVWGQMAETFIRETQSQ